MTRQLLPARITDLLRQRAECDAEGTVYYRRTAEKQWIAMSWASLARQVDEVAHLFVRMNLQPGDRVVILAPTCPEWLIAELAVLVARLIVVGIDPHASQEELASVLENCGPRCLIADRLETLQKIPPKSQEALKLVILIQGTSHKMDRPAGCVVNPISWPTTCLRSEDDLVSNLEIDQGSADEIATIIYTSGTTGLPKGIEYSHRQLMVACQSILEVFPEFSRGDRVICWLPMAHFFQRMMNLVAMTCGAAIYFVEDVRQIMDQVAEVKPSIFIGVPRFYEKLHEGIRRHALFTGGMRRKVVEAALSVSAASGNSRRNAATLSWWLRVQHFILDWLVLRKMRRVMGGKIRFMVTGSSAAPLWLLEFLYDLGLPLLEAYGLSENTIPIAANTIQAYRLGSVGKPLPMNEIKISSDGEILVKGPGLFVGYRGEGRPKERFSHDGFYCTGDYGYQDKDGFLFLTGRKSELIKTSTGRRISPVRIEGVYAQSPYVDEVVVIGNGRRHLVGLVYINVQAIKMELKLPPETVADDIAQLPETKQLLRRDMEKWGHTLNQYERLVDFCVLPRPLTVAVGELTSSLKLRRHHIELSYADVIDRLYNSPCFNQGSPEDLRILQVPN